MRSILAIILDKLVLGGVLAFLAFFLSRRLEVFKLRQTAFRERLKIRAENIRGLLRDMHTLKLEVADLSCEFEKNERETENFVRAKQAIITTLKRLLSELGAAKPWIGEGLSRSGSRFAGLIHEELEQILQRKETREIEVQMEEVESEFLRIASDALEAK